MKWWKIFRLSREAQRNADEEVGRSRERMIQSTRELEDALLLLDKVLSDTTERKKEDR